MEFGNTWVPELMKAENWTEAESIELNRWTRRFLKYAKSLPPSAMKLVPGKSISEVLSATDILRHSAVHRLPTSAAGMLNMLGVAVTFLEVFNDSKRAEKITEIKVQLGANLQDIVRHQNLLERKFGDQLEDIARQRARLDSLERSTIEEMLATDMKQRTEVGSALESFLTSCLQASGPCACSHTSKFEEAMGDSDAGEIMESNLIGTCLYALPSYFNFCPFLYLFLILHLEHEVKPSQSVHEARAYNQSRPGRERPFQGEQLKKDDRLPCCDNSCGIVKEGLEGSGSKGKMTAASTWDVPAVEEIPALVYTAPTSEDSSLASRHITPDTKCEWAQRWGRASGATDEVPAKLQTYRMESCICQ